MQSAGSVFFYPVSVGVGLGLVFGGLVFGSARCAFADESQTPQAVAPAPRAAAAPNADKAETTIDHLLKAARHLEAAGLTDEADRLRDDARRRAFRDDTLTRKESELECLQEEVDRLRALTGQAPAVRVDIVAVEVDRKKLGLKDRDFDKMIGFERVPLSAYDDESRGPAPVFRIQSQTFGVVEANPARLPLFKELVERGVVKVLARPTLTTATGRPASMHVGGEIPIRVKNSRDEVSIRNFLFGTQVEVLAVVLPNQRVRLQTMFEKREVNSHRTGNDDGAAYPEVLARRINTEVELRLGQTATLGGLIAEPAETIVFITPHLVYSPIVPRAITELPEGDDEESSQSIVPAAFGPLDGSVFGPPVPILKRRTVRE